MSVSGPGATMVVFLGPSLPLEEARRHLGADFRPPIRRGDVDRLLDGEQLPVLVGIVDGLFFHSFAVSPKEILRALRAGITVYGSSSMGALRAVELERWGMRGVGRIFELFRRGDLEADDEVAMTYGEDGRRPLSQPMVNIRYGFRLAHEAGRISHREARLLCGLAKRSYFPLRSFQQTLADARTRLHPDRLADLQRFLDERQPDLKREDAIELLRAMRREAELRGLVRTG